MEGITHAVPNLYQYTGDWFCYVSKVVSYYGNIYVTTCSMMVSVLKYILIVHWKKTRSFGEEKVKEALFWINIFYAVIVIMIHLMIKPDFFLEYDS